MSKIAREIAAVLAAYDCIYLGEASSTARLIDRVLEGKIIKRSELDGLRRCNSNLSAAATELEEELNQYRQAEEVETKLDNDANRVALGRYYKVPSGGTWTWSGEPQFYGKGLASKLSATTLPAEVEPETCPVTEQPAESPSKWRDFLSCIGFKN